jgi:hypothetical protein
MGRVKELVWDVQEYVDTLVSENYAYSVIFDRVRNVYGTMAAHWSTTYIKSQMGEQDNE